MLIAFSGFRNTERRQIVAQANILADNIRYIQSRAVRETRRHQIIMTVAGTGFRLQNARPLVYQTGIEWVDIYNGNLDGVTFAFITGGNTLGFTERGTVSTQATSISLDSANYRITLTVTLGAGRVLIGEPQRIIR